MHLDCDYQAHPLEIKVPGIGSSDSTAAAISMCTMKIPLRAIEQTEGPRVSDWALRARGGHEGNAWFALPAPSLTL